MFYRLTIFYIFALIPLLTIGQTNSNRLESQSIQELNETLKKTNLDDSEKIDVLRYLGEYYMDTPGDSATIYFNRAITLGKKVKDSLKLMKTYNRLALLQIYYEQDDRAITYADSSLQYANIKKKSHYVTIGYSYRTQAQARYYQERYDIALEKLLQANRFLSKDVNAPQSKASLAENYADLASIYILIDNNLTAKACIDKSLELAKSIDASYEVGEAYEFLATYYDKIEAYPTAVKYVDSAKTMYHKIDSQESIALLDKYLGTLYLKLNDYDQVTRIYKEQLPQEKENNIPYVLADSYTFLSKVETAKRNFVVAEKFLDSARTQAAKSGNIIHDIAIARQQAEIFKNQKQFKKAALELQEILNSNYILNYKESEKDLYEDLYQLYELENNQTMAYAYFKKYNHIKDSLKSVFDQNRFNVLQSEFNYNQLASDYEAKEAQLNLSQAEQKRSRDFNLFVIITISSLALFAFFSLIRQRKLSKTKREILKAKQEALKLKKEALDAEVRFKNQQITDFAIHISEKNELLEKVKTKLKSVKVISDSHKETVNDTIHFINNDIETDKEKIQLYQQIDQTTDSFRAKIDRLYDNLNEKEKKVATMLRLGQTSKQIALQLGISSASVDNYRYNLRKKMEIPKGYSLKKFIQEI